MICVSKGIQREMQELQGYNSKSQTLLLTKWFTWDDSLSVFFLTEYKMQSKLLVQSSFSYASLNLLFYDQKDIIDEVRGCEN